MTKELRCCLCGAVATRIARGKGYCGRPATHDAPATGHYEQAVQAQASEKRRVDSEVAVAQVLGRGWNFEYGRNAG